MIGVRVLTRCRLVAVATVWVLVGSGQAVAAEPWWHIAVISSAAGLNTGEEFANEYVLIPSKPTHPPQVPSLAKLPAAPRLQLD